MGAVWGQPEKVALGGPEEVEGPGRAEGNTRVEDMGPKELATGTGSLSGRPWSLSLSKMRTQAGCLQGRDLWEFHFKGDVHIGKPRGPRHGLGGAAGGRGRG